MRPLEAFVPSAWIVSYLLNSLWQIPLVFCAAWMAARVVSRGGPAVEHRIWVAALVFEVLLPGFSVSFDRLFGSLSRLISWSLDSHTAHAPAQITINSGPAYVHAQFHLPPHLLAIFAPVYGVVFICFAAPLLLGFRETSTLHRQAHRIVLSGAAAATWVRCSSHFAVHDAEAAISYEITCPVTIGVRRHILLFPASLPATLRKDDLDAIFAHEFAHMQRRDFARNLVYAVLSLPIAFHPLLWFTRTRIEESREMICDALAAEAVAGSQSYARSLLRLASVLAHGLPNRSLHAIGIFDANIFERRIMNLTRKPAKLRGVRMFVIAAACVIIGIGTCASALALRMNVAVSAFASTGRTEQPSDSATSPTHPVVLFTKQPEFPAQGRKDKINGTVVVSLIVNKEGAPTHVAIKESLRADFDQNAIEAVRQYKFKPALLNGNPIEYPLTIDIKFEIF